MFNVSKGRHAKKAPRKKHALAYRFSAVAAFLAAAGGATAFANNAHTYDRADAREYRDELKLADTGYFVTAQEVPGEIHFVDARSATDGKVKMVFYDVAQADVEKDNVKYGGVYFVTTLCTDGAHPSCSVTKIVESKTQSFRPLIQAVR